MRSREFEKEEGEIKGEEREGLDVDKRREEMYKESKRMIVKISFVGNG